MHEQVTLAQIIDQTRDVERAQLRHKGMTPNQCQVCQYVERRLAEMILEFGRNNPTKPF